MSRLPLQRIVAGKGRICTGPGIKTQHYVTEPCASIATIDLNTRLQYNSANKEQISSFLASSSQRLPIYKLRG